MKTSVIEVDGMLSALSVDEVEQRIGAVPGVESVTVNYAAGSATVRFDETRLDIADIKSAVRQRGYEPAPAAASTGDGHEGHTAPSAAPAAPAPAAPKPPPVASAIGGAAPAGTAQQDIAAPSTPPKPSPAAPAAAPTDISAARKSAPDAAAAAPAGDERQDKTTPDKR